MNYAYAYSLRVQTCLIIEFLLALSVKVLPGGVTKKQRGKIIDIL